ncbi:hypothetical protein ACFY6U_03960 [Streptomyces sp. NPDC013157]
MQLADGPEAGRRAPGAADGDMSAGVAETGVPCRSEARCGS